MQKRNNLILLCASACVFASNPKLSGQENTVNPVDTLAKQVQNINDELSKAKRLKITGYVQPQWQHIDSAGAPSFAGGDFINGTAKYNNRFTMRRGRFKFTYDYKNVQIMVNTDATEKGLAMRETFVKITDPRFKMFSLLAGLHQVMFGFEVTQSSSSRETPERARYNQTLFSTERDLGIFGSVVFPKTTALYGLKIDAAVINGVAGVNPEFDNHKDFTGRVQYERTSKNEKLIYAIGSSYYYGGYRIGSVKDYTFTTLAAGDKGYQFASDTANYNRLAKRIYMGADAQLSLDWKIGITTLRAEYITGEQPGVANNSLSPRNSPASAIYHRNFNGAYFYFVQNIGQSRFQAVVKYDWYDPNTKIAGKEIGKSGTNTKNIGDIRFDTYGFGLTFRISSNAKIIMYYDLVKNETTSVPGYLQDIKDNVTTVRMQVKF